MLLFGDLPSDPNSDECILCCPVPTLTKWVSPHLPLLNGDLTEGPRWLMISPGYYAATVVSDKLEKSSLA